MARFIWVTERNTDHGEDSDTEGSDYDSEDEEPPPLLARQANVDDKSEDEDDVPDTRGWQPAYSDSEEEDEPKYKRKSKKKTTHYSVNL
jgi:hypothetical protein